MSHPARGGWIEIDGGGNAGENSSSPTPHGVGGLKLPQSGSEPTTVSPTPHGVGGLKSANSEPGLPPPRSHPARGGWIEILSSVVIPDGVTVPPRTGWVD